MCEKVEEWQCHWESNEKGMKMPKDYCVNMVHNLFFFSFFYFKNISPNCEFRKSLNWEFKKYLNCEFRKSLNEYISQTTHFILQIPSKSTGT